MEEFLETGKKEEAEAEAVVVEREEEAIVSQIRKLQRSFRVLGKQK